MEEELKVTSPEEYAQIIKQRGELVPLPTGLVVRARRASMEGMALKGGLPMSLLRAGKSLQAVSEGLKSGDADFTPEQIEQMQEAHIFLREVVRKHCIEPMIVYSDGAVLWQWPNGTKLEIEDEDFDALTAWVQGEEVDEVDSFRNRKGRRALAAQSRRQTPRSEPVEDVEGQPA